MKKDGAFVRMPLIGQRQGNKTCIKCKGYNIVGLRLVGLLSNGLLFVNKLIVILLIKVFSFIVSKIKKNR
jgi:hypothetical protein